MTDPVPSRPVPRLFHSILFGRLDECLLELSVASDSLVLKHGSKTLFDIKLSLVFGIHLRPSSSPHVAATASDYDSFRGCTKVEICALSERERLLQARLEFPSADLARECAMTCQRAAFFSDFDPSDPRVPPLPLSPRGPHRRHMLVVINPLSGKKNGLARFRRFVEPILDLSHLTFELYVSQYPQHAIELIHEVFHPSRGFTEIGVFGGDGSLYEVVQGLMTHPRIPFTQLSSLPISLFPGGTGNGLAWELGVRHNSLPLSAVIAARGRTSCCDVCSVFHNDRRMYMTLVFSYGLHSNVDSRYQFLDFLGDGKYPLAAGLLMAEYRHYPATVKFVQCEERESNLSCDANGFDDPLILSAWTQHLDFGLIVADEDDEEGDQHSSLLDCPLIRDHFLSDLEEVAPSFVSNIIHSSSSSSSSSPSPYVVRSLSSDFFAILATLTRKVANDFFVGYNNTLDSGWMDLCLIHRHPNIGRVKIAKSLFLSAFSDHPDHIKPEMCGPLEESEGMHWERVKAFVFEPVESFEHELDVDGEKFACSKVIGEIHEKVLCFVRH